MPAATTKTGRYGSKRIVVGITSFFFLIYKLKMREQDNRYSSIGHWLFQTFETENVCCTTARLYI